MTEESGAFYEALFGLEEVRELLRLTAPDHRLSEEQKQKLLKILQSIRKNIDILENKLK